jgi:hypothetical protein
MATTDSEIIKEFLIGLGFKIDEAGMKKFGNALTGSAKGAMGVGAALIGAGFAVEKFVEHMANGMEKLFYISQRTGASVTNLKAMEGAFQSAGFAAGKSTEFIEGLAENLRANPGMTEFVSNMFGIDTASMDKAEAAMAIMKKLADMAKTGSYAVAAQQANLVFGMSERDFNTAVKNIDKIAAIEADRVALLKESGVNMGDLAEKSTEFNNNLRKMGADIGAIGSQLAVVLMPTVNTVMKAIEENLHMLVQGFGGSLATGGNFQDPLSAGFQTEEEQTALDTAKAKPENDPEIIARIAKQHGVDPLLADALWATESSRGQNMVNPKSGATGGFQIDPSNFAALHTNKTQMMETAPNAEAGMGMLERNINEFKDIEKAIAATNSTPEHVRQMVRQFGDDWLQHMPEETQQHLYTTLEHYGRNLKAGRMGADAPVSKKNPSGGDNAGAGANVNVTQNITQNIHGNDAATIGKSAAEQNRRDMGDLTRDTRGLLATPGKS